ncbi:MAG: YfcE family phosphodiesterase [Dehalococcoidia bacterium]|nr:YfcE family phosphodiesterase [Dehalococcoidia bacterium]MCA9850656.1 YfcE family phosphodiesterase [Dehalococcoidia bacterium]
MKLGIISDVHGNATSLERALDLMPDVDEVLCAGDLVSSFRFSNEVVARLREIGARVVLGNHDLDVLAPHGERVRASAATDPTLLRWLAEQPERLDTQINGRRVTMFHAVPEPPYGYVYAETPRMQQWSGLGADFVIYGHTHRALLHRVDDTLVINPGSAGQPRDARNGFRSSFAVLDTQSGEVLIQTYDDPVYRPHPGE